MIRENLKNILLSKCFAMNAIIVDKIKHISENSDEIKETEYSYDIKFNTNVLVKYPELYSYILDYIKLKYIDLFENITKVCCVNSFGTSFSNFLTFSNNLNLVNYYDLKDNKNQEIDLNIKDNNYKNNEDILFILDVLSSEQYLVDVLDVLHKNRLDCKKFVYLLDKRKVKNELDNSLLYPIFTEEDIYNYLNIKNSKNYFSNKLANQMYENALNKKSNLIISTNCSNIDKICNYIHRFGSKIIGIKINSDNIYNFYKEPIERLKYLKQIYNIIIIDNKKIINEYDSNFKNLISKFKSVTEWADAITIHSIAGNNVIYDIEEKDDKLDLNLILLNEINNNILLKEYYNQTSNKLIKHKNVCGYIGQNNIFNKTLLNYNCLSITLEYDYIDFYKMNNKLFWSIDDIHLKDEDMNVIEDKINKYKNIGYEYFIKY